MGLGWDDKHQYKQHGGLCKRLRLASKHDSLGRDRFLPSIYSIPQYVPLKISPKHGLKS